MSTDDPPAPPPFRGTPPARAQPTQPTQPTQPAQPTQPTPAQPASPGGPGSWPPPTTPPVTTASPTTTAPPTAPPVTTAPPAGPLGPTPPQPLRPAAPVWAPPTGSPMSPGVPTHPYAWPTPGAPVSTGGGRRVAIWLLLGSLALLCFVGVAVIGWWVANQGPDHPDEWDPAVVELVTFVESERAVDFDHPVYVDFLDQEQYRVLAGAGEAADPVEASELADEFAAEELALFRSLGLISGTPDLGAANEAIWADGTAAFYDPAEDRIVVRGLPVDGALPLELQVVVVHELAHALQHQVADLYGSDAPATTEESDALIAVLEGDASLVEGAFVEQLDPARYDELAAIESARYAEAEAAITGAGVPEVLSTMFSMPYQFGPSWVGVALEGPDATDLTTMLTVRPTTAQILGLVTGPEVGEAVEVDEPEEPDGAEVIYVDTWGAFSWVVPLVSWVDPGLAAGAVAAWAGDAVVVYRDDTGRVCFDAAVATSSAAGAATFAEAARAWTAQLPPQANASVEVDSSRVSVRSCDPGAQVEFTPSRDAVAELDRMAMANSIIAGGLAEGFGQEASRCFADGMIATYGVEGLQDDSVVLTPEFDRARDEWVERCGI